MTPTFTRSILTILVKSVTGRSSKVDPYGFERPDNFDYENYEDFMAHYLSVLAKRSQKWESHLHRHSLDSTNVRKCMYLSRSSILSIVVQMPDHAVSRFACLHRRALCMTKLMPVTHFGGHMDVNC